MGPEWHVRINFGKSPREPDEQTINMRLKQTRKVLRSDIAHDSKPKNV